VDDARLVVLNAMDARARGAEIAVRTKAIRAARVVGRDEHIADVSVTFERGSLNVLLGAMLSGKTSLMRILAGLDLPTAGRVVIDGQDVTGRAVPQRAVAMVYQQFINDPSLTVFENIAAYAARAPPASRRN
jgi:glycerol transport system ATP-binding protein